MGVQSLAVNQILQHLRETGIINQNNKSENILPVHSATILVKNHQVDTITFKMGGSREFDVQKLLEKKNSFFFNETLPGLCRKYKQFTYQFFFDDDCVIQFDEHSHIDGIWYFKSYEDFWEQIIFLQNELPEIFRQQDSEIRFAFRQGRIESMKYKYYFRDVITYPFVTELVKQHNETTFAFMFEAASRHQYGEIEVTEKNEKGQIIKWRLEKHLKI